MIFYRYYVNPPNAVRKLFGLPAIECEEYTGIKQTPCGWWIKPSQYATKDWCDKRWISNTSRKRWAYPTKAEALESLVIRKRRRQQYLVAELERAEHDNRIIAEWGRKHDMPETGEAK